MPEVACFGGLDEAVADDERAVDALYTATRRPLCLATLVKGRTQAHLPCRPRLRRIHRGIVERAKKYAIKGRPERRCRGSRWVTAARRAREMNESLELA